MPYWYIGNGAFRIGFAGSGSPASYLLYQYKDMQGINAGAMPPAHLDLVEEVKPIEQHGFTLVDFAPDKITLRFFKWDYKTQGADEIDTLQPFHTTELMPAT